MPVSGRKNSIAKFVISAALLAMLSQVGHAQDYNVNPRVALPFPPGISLQSQCGFVDDLQDVELYDGSLGVDQSYVQENESSTVQLQWRDEASIRQVLPAFVPGNIAGERWCSGTLIDDRHVLTAGHCFDIANGSNGWQTPWRVGQDGRPEYAKSAMLAPLQVVNFRYQVDKDTGGIRIADVYPIVALTEHREGPDDLDYAIVELGRNSEGILPGERYQFAKVEVREGSREEALAIIQHPQGLPKKIEAGELLDFDARDLFYSDIDTHGGSSGSGVRDGNGTVIGVHTNGGCVPGVENSANRGVSTPAIAAVSDTL